VLTSKEHSAAETGKGAKTDSEKMASQSMLVFMIHPIE
jgi:hypothetical protein